MKFQRIMLAFALALGVAGVAQADPVAMLYNVQGKVLVNQGQKFVPAQSGMALNIGDRLMVMSDSSAKVEYGSGCSTPLASNSTITITAHCHRGAIVPLAGSSESDFIPLALIGGGLVLIAVISSGGHSSKPISP